MSKLAAFFRGVLIVLGGVTLSAILLAVAMKWISGAPTMHPPERQLRLAEVRMVAAALFLHADRHAGVLPKSLEELKPDYLGPAVETGFLRFHLGGESLSGDRDGRIVAAELNSDAQGYRILIHGNRQVAFLRDGD